MQLNILLKTRHGIFGSVYLCVLGEKDEGEVFKQTHMFLEFLTEPQNIQPDEICM